MRTDARERVTLAREGLNVYYVFCSHRYPAPLRLTPPTSERARRGQLGGFLGRGRVAPGYPAERQRVADRLAA
jgi:hypothetical protein